MTSALRRVASAIRTADPWPVRQAEAVLAVVAAMLSEHLALYHGPERGYAAGVIEDFARAHRLPWPEAAAPPLRPDLPTISSLLAEGLARDPHPRSDRR